VLRSADFGAAREAGRRADGGWFLLWMRDRGDAAPARLGVAASRAVGPAVVRNRCKRLLREIFRQNQSALRPGLDIVISARAAMPGVEFTALQKRFLKIVDRLVGELSVQK
jgi:ribonuclease P protein component